MTDISSDGMLAHLDPLECACQALIALGVVEADSVQLSIGLEHAKELRAMRELLHAYLRALASQQLSDCAKLESLASRVSAGPRNRGSAPEADGSGRGGDEQKFPHLKKLVQASTELAEQLRKLEAEKWAKMEAASKKLEDAVAVAMDSGELGPLQSAMQEALRDGVGRKAPGYMKAESLEGALKEREAAMRRLHELIETGRSAFGLDFTDPDDHEYADADEESVAAMKATAEKLRTFVDDPKVLRSLAGPLAEATPRTPAEGSTAGPDVSDSIALPPKLAAQITEARRVATMLQTRASIVHLRFLVDEGGLESSTPYGEKTVTARAVELAIFAALDVGLGEESELYESAGALVDELTAAAEAFALEQLANDDHDDDLLAFPDAGDDVPLSDDEGLEGVKPFNPNMSKRLSFTDVRKVQRRNTLHKSDAEVAAHWVKVQSTASEHYFYNVATGKVQDSAPGDVEQVHEAFPLQNLKKVDPFLHNVILVQKIIRGQISRRRIESTRAERLLQKAIVIARRTRRVEGLLEAIHEALDKGLDDESDVYFEAGELMEALEDEDTAAMVEQRGGMEWTKMWDAGKKSYFYYNVVTNVSVTEVPADYDPARDTGAETLPKRIKTVLSLQTVFRGILRRWRASRAFVDSNSAATRIQSIFRTRIAQRNFRQLTASRRSLLELDAEAP
eukprot:INCI7654.3.p1 GENE.INCI7654.3~~INCI7654.3.p1  ORF type:complete len:680 (+),score=158.09 INCI7654.3:5313-7352(+)